MAETDIVDLGPAAEGLILLIEAVPEEHLERPTPCSEYSVGDLLDHIAGMTFAFGVAATKAAGPGGSVGPSGDAGNLPADWRSSLPRRVRELAVAWAVPAAWEGMTAVGGQSLPGQMAGVIAFGELSVHGWDLSRACGISFEPDPVGVSALLGLVRQTFGGQNQEGVRGTAFGPPVPVPPDAPAFDRVLGLLGRDPAWRP